MPIFIEPIKNGESGASVRNKLNRLIAGAEDGTLGGVTQEDLDAMVDTVAPDRPKAPILHTEWLNGVCYLYVNWAASTELDFAYYDLQVNEENGNWIGYQTATNQYELTVMPGLDYGARVRAVDKSGNMSAYSEEAHIIAAGDDSPPAMPIGVKVAAGTESIWVEWLGNTEPDMSHYEVYESEYSFTPDIGDTPTYTTSSNSFVRSGIAPESTLYYWVRAVDTSGNISPWSAGVTGTTSKVRRQVIVSLTDVTFMPSDGEPNRLTWTAGQVNYGFEGDPPTVQAIPAGNVTYSTDRVYVRYVLGDEKLTTTTSLIQLYSEDSVLIGVYKGGTDYQAVMGKSYMDGGLILAQTIGANQLVADQAVITGSAQIAQAIIEDAHIKELSAATLKAGTALAGTITVSGTALSTIRSYANNPAARINAASTQIDPGKITISGSTTLSDWRSGNDSTKINGGAIAANSITANLLTVGLRNISVDSIVFSGNSPSANRVAWSAGTIKYMADNGSMTSVAINAGSAAWSSGVLYVYWVKGATTLSTTTAYATALGANNLLLAAYEGGTILRTDLGRTIIDGANIKTGTIESDQLATGAVKADKIAVNNLAAIAVEAGNINVNAARINSGVLDVARIGDLTVDTIKIKNGAITSNTVIATGSDTDVTSDPNVWYNVLSLTLANPGNNPIVLWGELAVSGVVYEAQYRILRNGAEIPGREFVACGVIDIERSGSGGGRTRVPALFTRSITPIDFIDFPNTSGNVTYTMQVMRTLANQSVKVKQNTRLTAMAIKK